VESVTSSSLLLRMRNPEDEDAWEHFFSFYAPLILRYSRQCGCDRSMADDILQETLVALMKTIPTFRYDRARGRFRDYVRKVVRRRVGRAYKRSELRCSLEDHLHPDRRNQISDSKAVVPGAAWDELWDQQLLRAALARVRDRVEPLTFRSFELYVLDERPTAEVQAVLGIADRNTVYQHRSRVMKVLEEEMQKLREEVGE